MKIPPKRYLDGLVLDEMDSSEEWNDPPHDKVIKTFFVKAVLNETGAYDLVALIEVEVIGVPDGQDDDDGFIEIPREVYRLPFPENVAIRKGILRELKAHPQFHTA